MTQFITIPGWHPARLNQLVGNRWVAAGFKRADRAMIWAYGRQLVKAEGRRVVRLKIALASRQRAGDPDAYWKSLLDALTHAGLLIDDNRQGVVLAPVEFGRDLQKRTEIQLQDV